MIVCGCTGATDRDVAGATALGQAAGTRCGGCRPLVDQLRPPSCGFCPGVRAPHRLLGLPCCARCAFLAKEDPAFVAEALEVVTGVLRRRAQVPPASAEE